jgi:hypothetical protein
MRADERSKDEATPQAREDGIHVAEQSLDDGKIAARSEPIECDGSARRFARRD